ncbi:hypothetical protein RclHR1_36040001 [Rhizophagus clarus]|uniref:Uncharacterized protein n=1 Tax=Rhizophagus clarus TaxID=94130 RepID=A0A2Z6RT41_9GLOM|nr:hypothetical protein RclHR1_36040001 [Rhizophagus clarus]
MSGSNCKKIILNIDEQKLTAVLPSGSLNVKLTFYMPEQRFIETEESRFLDNPYILQRLPAEDYSNNNTTIGINLLYKEKAANDENLKEDILAVVLISLTKNIDDDHNSRINFPNKVDDGNMSLLIENMLIILDEIKSEDETSELSRRRNVRRYLYFHELYKKTLEAVASELKSFGETNASKAKDILENFFKKAEEKLMQRQWRSYRTSAERISKGIQKQQQEEKEVTDNDDGNSSNNSGNEGQGSGKGSESRGWESGRERGWEREKGRGRGRERENKDGNSKEKEKAV